MLTQLSCITHYTHHNEGTEMLPKNLHLTPWQTVNTTSTSPSSTGISTTTKSSFGIDENVLIYSGIDHDEFTEFINKNLSHLNKKDIKIIQANSILFNYHDYNFLHFLLGQQCWLKCKYLMVLELNNCGINNEGCFKIFEALQQLPAFTLKRIIMDNNPINDDGMQHILEILLSISSSTKENKFDEHKVGDDLSNLDDNNSLIYLSFENCNFGFIPQTWILWMEIMNKCIKLKQVNVKNNFIHPDCITEMLKEIKKLKKLESFEICGCRLSYLNSLKFVLNVPHTLTRLDVGNCDMNHPSYVHSEPDLSLPHFELTLPTKKATKHKGHWCCDIENPNEENSEMIGNDCHSDIEQLYFGHNSTLFGNMEYFEHFMKWIYLNCPDLMLLDLSYCNLEYKQISLLSKYMTFKPGLKFLNLAFNKINDESLLCLCDMIKKQVSLLSMEWINALNQLLMDVFQTKTSDLISNLIGIIQSYCYSKTSDIMEENGLIGLDLCGNNVTNQGAIAIFECICQNIPHNRQFLIDLTSNLLTNDIVNKLMVPRHSKISIVY